MADSAKYVTQIRKKLLKLPPQTPGIEGIPQPIS